jgi:alkaline phosphatase
VEAEIF